MSTTQAGDIPQHIAFIMDGNRRWANQYGLPVALGHVNGARKVRTIVEACAKRGVKFVTLFAFSTENWRRPTNEVSRLLGLFSIYLQKEIENLNQNGVRLIVIGDTSPFDDKLRLLIKNAQEKTATNNAITLIVAVNYGGRWDVVQAVKNWGSSNPSKSIHELTEEDISQHLSTSIAPDPDLLIRTGGESRISNFLIWQLRYTEMFFTDLLWPSFTAKDLDKAIEWYTKIDRRFGSSSTL